MNLSCARAAGVASASAASSQRQRRSVAGRCSSMRIHGSSPLRNMGRRIGSGSLKNASVGRSTMDRAALEVDHARGQPLGLAEVVRAHHHASCRRRRSRRSAPRPRAWRVGSRLAVGSSRNSTSGRTAQARASARRCCWPPDSARAGRCAELGEADALQRLRRRARRARARGTPRQPQRQQQVVRAPTGAAGTGAGTPSPGRHAAAIALHAPRAVERAAGRAAARSSVVLPEPLAPTSARRSPRRTRRSTPLQRHARAPKRTDGIAQRDQRGASCEPTRLAARAAGRRCDQRRCSRVDDADHAPAARGRAPAPAAGRPCWSRARSRSSSRA